MTRESDVRELPPRGHYLASEVGWLAGVSGNTIGQWARRGFIRSSQSSDQPRIYSFQDVAEAMVVHELLERGVPHADVRQAIEALRERYGSDWPLTHARLGTSAHRVVTEADSAAYDIGRHKWQQLNADDLDRIAVTLQRGGWPARHISDLQHVEVNPDRLSGRPVIRGKRVPVKLVAEIAERPGGIRDLREGYDLKDAEIRDAQRWWNAAQVSEANVA